MEASACTHMHSCLCCAHTYTYIHCMRVTVNCREEDVTCTMYPTPAGRTKGSIDVIAGTEREAGTVSVPPLEAQHTPTVTLELRTPPPHEGGKVNRVCDAVRKALMEVGNNR